MDKRDKIVADRIKQYIADKGIMQKWLAEKTGINRGSLSRKLNGFTEWTLCEAWDIANALGLDIAYFFE